MSRAELLQLPENTAGEVPFQDAFDLSVAESFVRASGHVFLGGFVELHADFDDDVQCHVQLPVSVAVEPVSGGVPRGGLQRCRPGEGRERGF